jgi:hypothetical protein
MSDKVKYQAWLKTAGELAQSKELEEGKREFIKQVLRLLREADGEGPGPTNTELPLEPQFDHDHTGCIFLGPWEDDEFQKYDLYYCTQRGTPTVLARMSSVGSDYYSGMFKAEEIPSLNEAKKRAIARGLIKE